MTARLEFEGTEIALFRVKVNGVGQAAGELSQAIRIGEDVAFVIRGACGGVEVKATKKDGVVRVAVVDASRAALVPLDRIEDLLDELEEDASARRGQRRLPGMEAPRPGSTFTVDADGTLLTSAEVAARQGAPVQEPPKLLVAFTPAGGSEEPEVVLWPDAWPDVAPPLLLEGDGTLPHPSGPDRHVVAVLATNGELRVPQWDEPDERLLEEASAWFDELRQPPAWADKAKLVEQIAEMQETSARYVAVAELQRTDGDPDEDVMLAVHRRLAVSAGLSFSEPGEAAAVVPEVPADAYVADGPADVLEDGLKIDEVRSRAAVVPVQLVRDALGVEEAKKRPRARVVKALREALEARASELDALVAAERLDSAPAGVAERDLPPLPDDDLFGEPQEVA